MKNIRLTLPYLIAVFLIGIFSIPMQAQTLNEIGGFESNLPAYWTKGNEPSGSTLSWATDESVSMGHSLKIEKTTTSDSASWISKNMCDIWSPTISANVDIKLGAWVKTMNVNTNPQSDAEKWWISYTFYDSAGNLIGEQKLPIDQSSASSSGWMADTNEVGQTILPKAAWKLIIKFVAGPKATGTVWADNFILVGRNGAWAGQDWNAEVGVPTGWYYWLPPNGGNDGLLSNGFENTMITSEAAHTGKYSLKFDLPKNRDTHDGFVSIKRMMFSNIDPDIKPGDVISINVWIKADSLMPDSAAKHPNTWAVGLTPGFFSGTGNNIGYSPVGSQNDYQFQFPNVTSFDWTQYHLKVQVPNDPDAKALEVRLHIYANFVGVVYFDDLTVTKVVAPQLQEIGGFESNLPAFWTKGNEPSGATLTWATDQSVSMGHSLKIDKSSTTSDSASWVSKNMCALWSPTVSPNVDIKLGAWVKTMNVNTNPTSNDEKWWISYTFYDSAGNLIGEQKLPIDQSTATSSDWMADTNDVGETILPKAAWKMIISFVAGKNATGTVWADNFIFYGRNGAWAGQDWNTELGVPTGWYYWLPPNGGNDGMLSNGFENTVVTSEASHSGNNSLKFVMPLNRDSHDGFVGTRRFMMNNSSDYQPLSKTVASKNGQMDISKLANVNPGDSIRINVWIKANGLYPDSAAAHPNTWAVGLTPGFFAGNGDNLGYSPVGSQNDYQFQFPSVTSFDWTQYHLDIQVPNDTSAKALEVRLHIYANFAGTVYFDDLTVEKLSMATGVSDLNKLVPSTFKVFQNYPNPFNPTTSISYSIPHSTNVKVEIYNILGKKIRTLINAPENAGVHNIVWNGRNDYGSEVSSGTYLYKVTAGNNVQVKKMVLLK